MIGTLQLYQGMVQKLNQYFEDLEKNETAVYHSGKRFYKSRQSELRRDGREVPTCGGEKVSVHSVRSVWKCLLSIQRDQSEC